MDVDLVGIIEKNPGIKFNEIMRNTGMKNGVLSHHLRKLEESGSVKITRTTGNTRYYPLGVGDEEMLVIKHLRQKTFYAVMMLLYENSDLSFRNIVQMTKFSSSGVSNTLSKLVSEGIVHVKFDKRNKLYHIDKSLIKKIVDICGHNTFTSNPKLILVYVLLTLSGFRFFSNSLFDFFNIY